MSFLGFFAVAHADKGSESEGRGVDFPQIVARFPPSPVYVHSTSTTTLTTWLSAIYVVYLRRKLSALYLCFTSTLPVGGKEAQSWGKSQKEDVLTPGSGISIHLLQYITAARTTRGLFGVAP